MQIVIEIDEARYKDIQRIAEVQLESNHFQTAEQILAKGIPIEQEPILDKIRAEIKARLCDVVSDYTDGYRTAIQGDLAILDRYKTEGDKE
jgi:hypothetical protein